MLVRLYLPIIPFLAALAFSPACSSRNHQDEASITAARVAGPLRVTLAIDRQVYQRDMPVHLTITAFNTANSPITLTFPSGQSYDFTVRRDGNEIWRWSHERFFTQAIREQTIDPGDSLTYTEIWEQVNNDGERVSPGKYEAAGTLTVMDRITTPAVAFSIGE